VTLRECFVAQVFDSGPYDQRYRETFAPAIQAAGATPIRADEVLGTYPVIEKIENALKKSAIAFAEVSENNPNVFLEVGYAIALGIPLVIVCDKTKRDKLPFDIQHRPVIFYSTHAQSDFERLRHDVERGVSAALSEVRASGTTLDYIVANDETSEQADAIKRLCLLELLDQDMRTPQGSSVWELQRELKSSEVSDRMIALAVTGLVADGLVEKVDRTDENGNDYRTYNLSDDGQKKILREYAALMKEESHRLKGISLLEETSNDDVPF
jgi:hypothetical protein